MPTYGKIKVNTLTYDSSGSAVDFAVGDIASKSSPTFTGDVTLTGASYNVVFDASDNALEFADNAKAVFGDGPDLSIYHDTNNSYLEDSGTGALVLAANQVAIWDAAKSETMFVATENGSVDLFHKNSKKLETTAAGVTVTGSVSDSKGDVRLAPYSAKSSAYELVASDSGKAISNSSGGWTIPDNTIAAGSMITFINNSGSDQTIAAKAGQGFQFYLANDTTIKTTITLAGRGMATMYFASSGTGYISGAGLS